MYIMALFIHIHFCQEIQNNHQIIFVIDFLTKLDWSELSMQQLFKYVGKALKSG